MAAGLRCNAMPPLAQALTPWHDFYVLLGTASATMVGLLFVAASVAGGVFSQNRSGALRIFLSASVVHFSSILATCLMVLAPVRWWELLGGIILAGWVFGLAYSGMAWRDTAHGDLRARIDLEDRIWYAVLPAVGYLFEAGAGVAFALQLGLGCAALAMSVGGLLLVAIHNAWDITVWSIIRRRE
jgi:hypothetical protein